MKKSMVKRSLLALSALSCAFVFAGCDAIEALPGNYLDALIVDKDGKDVDVYDNIFSKAYDAVTSGKNERILNDLLYAIAQDQFGSFKDLKAAVESKDDAKILAFAKKHAAVYEQDDDDEELVKKFAGVTLDTIRISRVNAFYQRIRDRLTEYYYTEVTGGAYADRDIFDEKKMAQDHWGRGYDIDTERDDFYLGYITPDVKKHDVSMVIDIDKYYSDYSDRAFLPDIYRKLLVEQYIYDEDYSAIGRAYGRKVNVIKLPEAKEYHDANGYLMTAFVDRYVFGLTDEDDAEIQKNDIDYDRLANAWRGFKGLTKEGLILINDEAELALQEAAAAKAALTAKERYTAKKLDKDVDADKARLAMLVEAGLIEKDTSFTYYPWTELGLLLDRFFKIDADNRFADEEAKKALDDFTGSHAYAKETGLRLKVDALIKKNYRDDGWYLKDGGLDDLSDAEPTKIRSRLFNINVANEIDHPEKFGAMETKLPTDNSQYDPQRRVRWINDHYFLTPKISEQATKNGRNIIMPVEGTVHLVEVVEAVSSSKLAKTGIKDNYATLRSEEGASFTEETAFSLAHILSSKENYVKSAYQHYIELYKVIYHDTAVFDYFKAQYPDLFDDKD